MKKASKIMYIVSLIFAICATIAGLIIGIVGIVGIVGGSMGAAQGGENVDPEAAAVVIGASVGVAIWGSYLLTAGILGIIFASISIKKAKLLEPSKGWSIAMIVIGVCTLDLFLLLGGVFGLVAYSRRPKIEPINE